MEAALTSYYLGPLGALKALPIIPIKAGVGIDTARVGGEHISINGRLTLDRVTHKRSWKMDWRCLEADDTAPIRATFLGLSKAKLRLLDPRQRNRFSVDASSGGCYTRSTAAFTASAGVLTFRTLTGLPAELWGLDGGLDWEVPAGGARLLADDGTLTRVPLLASEQVTVSAWVYGSGSVRLGAVPYDVNGAAQPDQLAAAATLTGGWQRLSHTFTPAAGQVAAAGLLVAPAGTARTLNSTGWQWQPGALSAWVPGDGAPHVVVAAQPRTVPALAGHDIGATIREV